MASKQEMNRAVQELEQALAKAAHAANTWQATAVAAQEAKLNTAMADGLARQVKVQAVLIGRLQQRLAARRWTWYRRAWTRIKAVVYGRHINHP